MERRFTEPKSPEERLADEAKLLVRDATIRAARQAEIGAHKSEWLSSPGLKAPT